MIRITLRKVTLFAIVTVYLIALVAKAESQEPDHAIGVHGMAIFKVAETYYASHMPLANSIHAHQVILSFSLAEGHSNQLEKLLDEHELVSLMPEVFDLHDLMNGELTEFQGTVHANHFERGGKVAMQDVQINVEELLLVEPLTDSENGEFYLLELSSDEDMLVHKIGANPSFDQILTVEPKADTNDGEVQILEMTEGKPLNPGQLSDNSKFSNIKQLYLETRDFQ